ncbi:MAG: hypothetical protein IJX25_04025 [Clostridia bacterium]|nr:hypothetical protein [Clostridia bacterium]MBQ8792293.1 hypothetical protein [Clostridia bacterium]
MKETMMLLGFGMGLVTGALLYKYSTCAKKVVDKGEKKIMQEVDNMEEQVKDAVNKAEKKLKG